MRRRAGLDAGEPLTRERRGQGGPEGSEGRPLVGTCPGLGWWERGGPTGPVTLPGSLSAPCTDLWPGPSGMCASSCPVFPWLLEQPTALVLTVPCVPSLPCGWPHTVPFPSAPLRGFYASRRKEVAVCCALICPRSFLYKELQFSDFHFSPRSGFMVLRSSDHRQISRGHREGLAELPVLQPQSRAAGL